MKGIRIEPSSDSVRIDVVCDCGNNCLLNTVTGESSFKHSVLLDSRYSPQFVLRCQECGAEYLVVSQRDHIHVTDHKKAQPV